MPAVDDMGVMSSLQRRASSGQNSHTGSSSSLSAFLSTLIPVLIVATIFFVLFLIFQKKYERVYGPRTYLASLRNWQYAPKRGTGLFGWSKEYRMLADEFVLGRSSIDNYFWIRFFKMLCLMCFVGALITWPILFPVNATGGGTGKQFDAISFSNIRPGPRYYAQTFVSWVFLAFVMVLITREARFNLRLRQLYLASPYESSRISNRSVLFTNVPEDARNEEHLRKMFAGVRSVWLVNVPTDLADNVDKRDTAAGKLDSGETKIIKNHVKRQLKLEKKGKAPEPPSPEALEAAGPGGRVPIEVNKKDRPMHRLPVLKVLPLGKKVDTIDWSRGELQRLIPQVEKEQLAHRQSKDLPQGACFIEFDSVQSAHAAVLQLGQEKKAKMVARQLGVAPDEVIWGNIIKAPAKVATFKTASTAFVWWLCIFWAIPVAVVGIISNVPSLTNKVHFLSFINHIPKVILGVVTGLLPVVMLAVLMALVPIVMGILAGLFEPTRGQQQLRVQSWYFPFQVIQVFLITTFASAATAVVTTIVQDPTKAPTLLAQNLPKAANFYIAYFVLYGLNAAASAFLNLVPLLFFLILGKFFDGTPRKMFNRFVNLGGVGWGASYPVYTNLGVIALAYSSIAPLVLGFATVGFLLLYLGFRYNVLFVLGTTYTTNGAAYARALQQLTVGIYISEICLIGLFAIGTAKSRQSIGPLVLQFIFLAATILWHIWLNRSLSKLARTVPQSEIAEKAALAGPSAETDGTNGVHATNGSSSANGADPGMHPGFNGTHDNATTALPPTVPDMKPESAEDDVSQSFSPDLPATVSQPHIKRSIGERVKAFIKPEDDAARVMRELAPHVAVALPPYPQQIHDDAFIHPAVKSPCPLVWIPRDKYGLSTQEIAGSKEFIGVSGDSFQMTDEGAWFNEKGKIQWDIENVKKMPVWEDKPLY